MGLCMAQPCSVVACPAPCVAVRAADWDTEPQSCATSCGSSHHQVLGSGKIWTLELVPQGGAGQGPRAEVAPVGSRWGACM